MAKKPRNKKMNNIEMPEMPETESEVYISPLSPKEETETKSLEKEHKYDYDEDIKIIKENKDTPIEKIIAYLELKRKLSEKIESSEKINKRIIKNYSIEDTYTKEIIKAIGAITYEIVSIFEKSHRNEYKYTSIEISRYIEIVQKERQEIESAQKDIKELLVNATKESKRLIKATSNIITDNVKKSHKIPTEKLTENREKIENAYRKIQEEIKKNTYELEEYTEDIRNALKHIKSLKSKQVQKSKLKILASGIAGGFLIGLILLFNLKQTPSDQDRKSLENFIQGQTNTVKTTITNKGETTYEILKIEDVYPYKETKIKPNRMYYDSQKKEIVIITKQK